MSDGGSGSGDMVLKRPVKPSAPVPVAPVYVAPAQSSANNNDDDDADDDEDEPLALGTAAATGAADGGLQAKEATASVLLTVVYQHNAKAVRLSPLCVVDTAIRLLLRDFGQDEAAATISGDFRLYKMARGAAAATASVERQLLDGAANLVQNGVRHGDELRLKNIRDKGLVQISRVATGAFASFHFDFSTTVRQALVALLRDQAVPEAHADQYGLYYAAKGIWLDPERTLELYDIDPQHAIDLRKLSQDVLLKISVPDNVNQMNLTFKVPKSSTVGEIVNLVTRRVNTEHPYLYGVYLSQHAIWLDESKTIQDYGLQNQTKLEYKFKFRQITIVRDGDWGNCGAVANGSAKSAMNIMVDLRASVADIVNLLRLNDSLLFEEERHVLVWQHGEIIPMDTLAQDLPQKDVFDLRVCPLPIYITPHYDPSAKVAFYVDFTCPLKRVLICFNRRLGVQQDDFSELCTVDGTALDVERSLSAQQIMPSSVLILKPKGYGWEKRSPEDVANPSDDFNIWDEPRDNERNITFEDATGSASNAPLIAAGTLNKLTEKLSDDKNHDLNYMKMFLLTYQSFVSPAKLITKIGERYYVPRPKGMAYEDFDRNVRRPIQLRVVNFLKQWIEKYSRDFYLDKPQNLSEVGTEVLKFSREVLAVDEPKLAKQLIGLLQRLAQKDYQFDEQLAPMPRVPFVAKPKLFQYHPEEIARQLTLIEFELFSVIKPSEFLNQSWNKKNSAITSPNILNISARFNKMVLWVIRAILNKTEVKKRAQRMTKIIDIASYLQSLNNFSTLMAFVAGLNAAAITRLKFTRAELNSRTQKRLEALEQLMSADGSYKQYRAEIHRSEPPIIPYIGVYLADLTFIDDGNPDTINGLINFSKRRLDYSVISEIQLYQNKSFNLRDYPELRIRLQDLPDPSDGDDKALYELSLKLEPRGADRSQIL